MQKYQTLFENAPKNAVESFLLICLTVFILLTTLYICNVRLCGNKKEQRITLTEVYHSETACEVWLKSGKEGIRDPAHYDKLRGCLCRQTILIS